MNIDKKSLIVGVLLGVCLCLLLQFVPQAQAQVRPALVPRYYIAGDGPGYGVIDSVTGDVYELYHRQKRWSWRQLGKGPPR